MTPTDRNPGSDPIWDFLREQMQDGSILERRDMKRRWKAAPLKIAGLATALVVISGSIGLLTAHGFREDRPQISGRTIEIAVMDEDLPGNREMTGRISLLEGSVVLARDGSRIILSEGDQIIDGDWVESSKGSAIGISFPNGLAVVLDGEGRLDIWQIHTRSVHVGLGGGVLAARVPPPENGEPRMSMRIEGSNASLIVRGTVFTVAARNGRLTDAAVSTGTVEVQRMGKGRVFRVTKTKALDMMTWSVADGEPDTHALGRLARITSGVVVPRGPAQTETIEEQVEHLTLVAKIHRLLAAGDVEAALILVEKNGKAQKGASFLLAAGEAYRHAGMWSEAAQAYLDGAGAGQGKKAEKAMIRAADIYMRKLGKTQEASSVIDVYLKRFPDGRHLDEALYLGGVAQSKNGNYKRARNMFESYLVKFPTGSQAKRVHLSLAKILVVKMSDCSAAIFHIKAVQAGGGVLGAQAGKLALQCAGQ
ncbi:MAG: tetratricopeptide repeat protein [Deltaproteobacteria bacterium]|nr:tetratricopeptide repeat protein [Deltaproteobacteria bacterium]